MYNQVIRFSVPLEFKVKKKFGLFSSNQDRSNEIINIGFLGLGRIGLPQSLVFSNKGLNVFGFDINPVAIEGLTKSIVPFEEPSMANYLDNNLNKTFFPKVLTQDSYQELAQMDAVIFTLGTPAPSDQSCLENNRPNLSAHYSIIDSLFTSDFKKGIVLIFRTTFPLGATDEIKKYIEFNYLLKEGVDFSLAFVPERLMEGRAIHEEENLPKIIGTYNEKAFSLVRALFEKIGGEIVRVDTPLTAEFCKLADNSYRSTMFAFSNDLAMLGNNVGVNTLSVIHAINLGYLRNNLPRPGFVSGYCLGKDPYILEQQFKFRDFQSVWFAGRKTNDYLVNYSVEKVLKNLPNQGKSRVTILGLSFKENIDDFRMSHALSIIEKLIANGVTAIDIYDPNLGLNQYTQIPQSIASSIDRSTCKLSPEFFSNSQAIIVCHRHKELIEITKNNELPVILSQVSQSCYIFDGWSIWTKAKNIKGICYEGLGYPSQITSALLNEEKSAILSDLISSSPLARL